MKLSDRLLILEIRFRRWWGAVVCQWRGRHVFSPFYPPHYCARCGMYDPPVFHIEPDYPDWYKDHYSKVNEKNGVKS